MRIRSTFDDNQEVPKSNTCLGKNISPALRFENIPEGTKSLVLIFEDVDATPKPWTHWMLFNIPPTVTEVQEGTIPEGATEGLANNHSFGYEGPCPRYFKGTHHYWFRLYALDAVLNLPKNSEREDVEEQMKDHIIEKAELLGLCTASVTIEA